MIQCNSGHQPKPGFVVMEIQPKKEARTELSHSQIVAPQRESILTAVEIQPEKEDPRGIKFLAFESWVRTLLGRISVGRTEEEDIVRDSIRRIGAADPANVQMIAAAQMELPAVALQQRRAFCELRYCQSVHSRPCRGSLNPSLRP
ncbi:hypothetical protein [Bradyrhizobium sp. URHC0002]